MTGEVTNLREQVSALKAELPGLTGQRDQLKAELADLTEKRKAVRDRLERERAEADKEVNGLQAKLASLGLSRARAST